MTPEAQQRRSSRRYTGPVCPNFRQDELIHRSDDGTISYMACPSIGVVYAPPLSQAALIELLFPDSWGLLPPG